MELEIGNIIEVLAEGVKQKKIKEEAGLAVGIINIEGRLYQVQVILEPIKAKHFKSGAIQSGGKVIVEDTRELYPEFAEVFADNHSPILQNRLISLINIGYQIDPQNEGVIFSPKGGGITFEELEGMGEAHFQSLLDEQAEQELEKEYEDFKAWEETQERKE